jgi:hypothetical protein
MLFNVGYGVNRFKNETSDSQDGCRKRRAAGIIRFPVLELDVSNEVDDVVAKALRKSLLAMEYISGSPVEKLRTEETAEGIALARLFAAVDNAGEVAARECTAGDVPCAASWARRSFSTISDCF